MGPNGIGKTVIADAVRFTLGSNVTMSTVRVTCAAEAINHTLVHKLGDAAFCITEVGFSIHPEGALTDSVYLSVRKRAQASGECMYYAAKLDCLPTLETWTQTTLPQLRLVRTPGVMNAYNRLVDT